jgi:hypothetical protein
MPRYIIYDCLSDFIYGDCLAADPTDADLIGPEYVSETEYHLHDERYDSASPYALEVREAPDAYQIPAGESLAWYDSLPHRGYVWR